jgi:hypothetical protein
MQRIETWRDLVELIGMAARLGKNGDPRESLFKTMKIS